VYNLCRHKSQADFCGQGPQDINKKDLPDLAAAAGRYFFARKFPTNNTRVRILK